MNKEIKLGLKENFGQFALLVVVNAFVGAMIGLERSILPEIGEKEFSLAAKSAVLSFIVVFGLTKAITNYFAGRLSDQYGRKWVLIAGWIFSIPVPFILMWANHWNWILVANVFLGISQGLAWSTTVIMKIDLVGPNKRGLAMGLNEFAGYFAVAISAYLTGVIAHNYGLRPEPFYLGIVYVFFGMVLSIFFVKETKHHVSHEIKNHHNDEHEEFSQKEIFLKTTFKDKNLSSVTQGGLVNNLNDGMAWGLFPLLYASAGLSIGKIGIITAIYPASWGLFQLVTGHLSDSWGRKGLIVWGMWLQGFGILTTLFFQNTFGFVTGGLMLGLGTAMVYPTFLAAIGDVAHPAWRASSVGIYRLWRDAGYAFGAILSGIIADFLGLNWAIGAIAGLTFLSGLFVLIRMSETLKNKNFECINVSELEKDNSVLIDVRSTDEFNQGHVDGAINIPLDLIKNGNEKLEGIEVVTICGKGGGRSEEAASLLRAKYPNSTVRSLCGGYEAWKKEKIIP